MKAQVPPLAVTVVLLLGTFAPAFAQDIIDGARQSYAAAEYDECVKALDRLDTAALPPGQVVVAGEYRALCLVALNRDTDAGQAIEKVLQAEPTYRAPINASPRLKLLVDTVRQSALPSIVQQRYVAAKSAYDGRRYEEATEGFRTVIRLLNDLPAMASSDTALPDYRTLASGFLDLMAAAVPRPGSGAARPEIYTAADDGVTAPAPISQKLPVWNAGASITQNGIPHRGRLELVIDRDGAVESAKLLEPLHPTYDHLLVRAARQWKYEPAKKDGAPVKFRKLMEVVLHPR
jgi:hypothetical protein